MLFSSLNQTLTQKPNTSLAKVTPFFQNHETPIQKFKFSLTLLKLRLAHLFAANGVPTCSDWQSLELVHSPGGEARLLRMAATGVLPT